VLGSFFVDYTTQEYFEHIRESRFPDAEARITTTCIQYLSFDVFKRGYCRDDWELGLFLAANPLLDYAA
jgi:hypothetical protein